MSLKEVIVRNDKISATNSAKLLLCYCVLAIGPTGVNFVELCDTLNEWDCGLSPKDVEAVLVKLHERELVTLSLFFVSLTNAGHKLHDMFVSDLIEEVDKMRALNNELA